MQPNIPPSETLKALTLKNVSSDGLPIEATFLPEKGMNLISYKKGAVDVIDQSTWNLFEERFAGLGALIGPHFHRRKDSALPVIMDESLFPHIGRVKAKGVKDPFSHGIARYAPWKAEVKGSKVIAKLTGKDTWNGIALAALEGQNFTMSYEAELTPRGLQIEISVVSDTDSLVGIHYYYHLPKGSGTVISTVQNSYLDAKHERKAIPQDWDLDERHTLRFDLSREADFTFFPFPNPLQTEIILDTGDYRLKTRYYDKCQENCWQLYHPAGASFVCIEPLSAQDPRHPNLTVSSLQILLEIEK
jgi:hypothetical protein